MAKRSAAPSQIREWANDNGHTVGVRGRLSAEVQDAFYANHTPSGKPKQPKD